MCLGPKMLQMCKNQIISRAFWRQFVHALQKQQN
jgi:hypothetical protein